MGYFYPVTISGLDGGGETVLGLAVAGVKRYLILVELQRTSYPCEDKQGGRLLGFQFITKLLWDLVQPGVSTHAIPYSSREVLVNFPRERT